MSKYPAAQNSAEVQIDSELPVLLIQHAACMLDRSVFDWCGNWQNSALAS